MFDLIEGAKIMNGYVPTDASTDAGYADWINMEGMHSIWALVSCGSTGTTGVEFAGFVSDSYAGATPIRATCQYWHSTGVAIDRMVASTQTTGLNAGDGVGSVMAIRFDPASRSGSSQQYFSVARTAGDAHATIIYVGQPRYGGLGQILATSSST